MKKEIELVLSPAQASSTDSILPVAARELDVTPSDVSFIRILRKSIDARNRNVKVNLVCEVYVDEDPAPAVQHDYTYQDVRQRPEVVIIGAGPAGLFAALRLIELGYRPLLLERGKTVSQRKNDIDRLESDHVLDPDSNYCFGEGGAGAFSDGKLYTRSTKRGNTGRILEILYLHGADESILYESHPHIGSDRLPGIIKNIRHTILEAGGQICFECRVTDLLLSNDRVTAVVTAKGEKIKVNALILATGHSARDMYYLLHAKAVDMEAKAFAMGVRVEHPQELIDAIQYHGKKNRHLPAATYSLATQVSSRGVYSFCMCPGGQIIPAATSEEEIVVNGMSVAARSSPFANSGIVVQVSARDYNSFANLGGLAGLRLQEHYEQQAYSQVARGQKAPAQRMTDFLSNRLSQDLPVCSYLPGVISSPMHEWLAPFIKTSLKEGLRNFGKSMKGWLTRDAILVGVESRTSSPVRLPRDPVSGSHTRIGNLFAAGEGAGYSGGIVSSAVDGENCAVNCVRFLSG